MGVESVNWGNVTTASTSVDAMSELLPGEKSSSSAISVNNVSVAAEGGVRGSGTGTPFKITQKANSDASDYILGRKAEVVKTSDEVDAAASALLEERMSDEGQPKV